MSSEEARRLFADRARIISAIRRYLDGEGFIEVETPVLQPIYGGAFARPSPPTTTRSIARSTCGSRPSCISSGCSSAASSAYTSSARTSATRASPPSTTPSSRWSSGRGLRRLQRRRTPARRGAAGCRHGDRLRRAARLPEPLPAAHAGGGDPRGDRGRRMAHRRPLRLPRRSPRPTLARAPIPPGRRGRSWWTSCSPSTSSRP